MKTVGTKLDNSEYEIFEFCCNNLGLTKSEMLRDLVKTFVNKTNEDIEEEEPVTQSIIKRVSSDNGKTWYDIKTTYELITSNVEY